MSTECHAVLIHYTPHNFTIPSLDPCLAPFYGLHSTNRSILSVACSSGQVVCTTPFLKRFMPFPYLYIRPYSFCSFSFHPCCDQQNSVYTSLIAVSVSFWLFKRPCVRFVHQLSAEPIDRSFSYKEAGCSSLCYSVFQTHSIFMFFFCV